MAAQLFLIAPADAGPTDPRRRPRAASLQATEVAALLLPRGTRPENAYKDFVKAVAPAAQAAGCRRPDRGRARAGPDCWAPTACMSPAASDAVQATPSPR